MERKNDFLDCSRTLWKDVGRFGTEKLKKKTLLFPDISFLDILNESLNDFVFLSESSARANLIRIASGRNT